jgi:hypothetical protein
METERRKYARHEVSWPVVLTTAKSSWVGEVENISPVGALIHCSLLPDQKCLLNVKIELPNNVSVVSATARVVYCRVEEGKNSSPSYRFGVHFLNISAKNRVLILNAVSSHSLN